MGKKLERLIVFLSLVAAAQCQQQAKSIDWTLADVQCAPEDSPTAIHRLAAFTETHCAMQAGEGARTGALVAQFSQLTLTCTVFNFQSICRHLIPGRTPNCAVIYRFPINHRSMNAKLNNVWLADAVSRLENLVCQADEDTNRLHPVAVQWSSEGAVFDGAAAHAVLNKSSLSFATGLTWLLRIKRQPRVQPIFELFNCSNLEGFTGFGVHMWEFSTPRRLYVRANRITGKLLPFTYSPMNFLSASPDDWLNIAVAVFEGSVDVFVGDSCISKGDLTFLTDDSHCNVSSDNACLYFGMRVSPPKNAMFNGTLRALAFASTNLSEVEIRQFFSLIQ